MILWILAISTVVWCDDQPKVDPTTRIQKHEIGKAVIYDRMDWGILEIPLQKVFEGDTELAWNSVFDDCEAAGISNGKRINTHNLFICASQAATYTTTVKLNNEDCNFYLKSLDPYFVFSMGLVEQFLKKVWNLSEEQEDYLHRLQPFVTMKPIHCFSHNKTIVFMVTYPKVKHIGHILETWDAGALFMDKKLYSYLDMPFHLIRADDLYFKYNQTLCIVKSDFIICHLKHVEFMEKCHPDYPLDRNIVDCERSVVDLKNKTFVRQMSCFHLVVSPLAEFTRNTDNFYVKVKLSPQTLTYIKLGFGENFLFDDVTTVYNVSDGKPFFMTPFIYEVFVDDMSSQSEESVYSVEYDLVVYNQRWESAKELLIFLIVMFVLDFVAIMNTFRRRI